MKSKIFDTKYEKPKKIGVNCWDFEFQHQFENGYFLINPIDDLVGTIGTLERANKSLNLLQIYVPKGLGVWAAAKDYYLFDILSDNQSSSLFISTGEFLSDSFRKDYFKNYMMDQLYSLLYEFDAYNLSETQKNNYNTLISTLYR